MDESVCGLRDFAGPIPSVLSLKKTLALCWLVCTTYSVVLYPPSFLPIYLPAYVNRFCLVFFTQKEENLLIFWKEIHAIRKQRNRLKICAKTFECNQTCVLYVGLLRLASEVVIIIISSRLCNLLELSKKWSYIMSIRK